MNSLTYAFKKILNQKIGYLDQKWEYDTGSLLLSSPVVSDIDGDGKKEIIFGTKDGRIISIDLNGELKWSYAAQQNLTDLELMFLDADTSNSISSSPNTEDIDFDGKKETIFGTEAGILYALDHNGKELWKYKAQGPIRSSPFIQKFSNKQAGIIFGSSDHNLYFLNSQGKLIWKYECDSEVESCPAILFGKMPLIVFGTNNGMIYALDLKGQLIWKFKTNGKVVAQPNCELIEQGLRIIIGSTDGLLYCFDEAGQLIWTFSTEGAIYSKANIVDINKDSKKEIVFGSCDNCVYALTIEGRKLWSYETDFWVVATPTVTDLDGDGHVEIVAGSYDHNIYVLDAEGSYVLDYVPGVSGIVSQTGHYGDAITQEPGKTQGKKIWQYQTDGIVVGCVYIDHEKNLIVNTDSGKVNNIIHKRE